MKHLKRALSILLTLCLLLSALPSVPAGTASTFNLAAGTDALTASIEPPPKPREPNFAEDRVIVKLANNPRMRVMDAAAPDFGIAYSEIHMLNPAKENANGFFSAQNVTGTQNNMFVLTLAEPGKNAVQDALQILNANPAVEYAEPDYFRQLNATPNDPMYNAQYALEKINAEQAWDITIGSKSVVVGVIDTGIDGAHPDLKDNLWVNPNPGQNGYINDIHGYDFTGKTGGVPTDPNGHGTHVAGIIGAKGNNGEGVSGVNWNVSLAWLGISEGGNYLSDSAAIEALNYANNHNILITNNSWGNNEYSEALYEAILNYNGLFVASAGNDSANNDGRPNYPANYDCPNIISVASTDSSDDLSDFSNYGPRSVHIAAPGSKVLSTYLGGTYRVLSGTSMASPQVAGIAALIKAVNPAWSPRQVKAAICGTVRQTPSVGARVVYGGIADANAALLVNTFYTVTYHFNDGVRTPLLDYVIPGGKLPEPKWPQRDGYVFNGWYTSASGGSLHSFDTPVNGNLTLYARWVTTEPGMYAAEFPDTNFRREVLQLMNERDGGNRTSVSLVDGNESAALASITYLDVGSMDIHDMTGLKYFTGLETLLCNENRLTELDVSDKAELVHLQCYDNLLTELDVSKNLELKWLSCSHLALTELDVSNNLELIQLSCDAYWWHTDLWPRPDCELDVSKNTELTELSCSNVWFTELDLSNNTELIYLDCHQNALTTLDVSKNTKLTTLKCYVNRLTKLDVSNNLALEKLDFSFNYFMSAPDMSKNTELKELYCSGNYLTELDISNNLKLTTLVCAENYMKSPDDVIGWRNCWDQAGDVRERGWFETGFWFYPQNEGKLPDQPTGKEITGAFTDSNFLAAVREVTGKPEGPITDYDVMVINSLDVSDRNISDLSGIEHFGFLYLLNCNYNQLTELDVSKNYFLVDLRCEYNQLTELDVSNNTALTMFLCQSNQLTTLDVSNNTELTDFACADNQLTTLDVSGNTKLRMLNCGGNKLTTLDVSNNTALTTLYCGSNQLTTLDVSYNLALMLLYCGNNYFSDKSAIIGLDEDITTYFSFDPQRTLPSTPYSISITPLTNGNITVSHTAAAAGTTVTLTVTPDSGYLLKAGTLKYNGAVITGGSFIMPMADVTVTAEFEPLPYRVEYYKGSLDESDRIINGTEIGKKEFPTGHKLTPADVTDDLGKGWLNLHKPPDHGVALVSYPTISDDLGKNVVKVLYMPR